MTRLIPTAAASACLALLLAATLAACDATDSGGPCSAVSAPAADRYDDLPLGRGVSDGPRGRLESPAAVEFLPAGDFAGRFYVNISSAQEDDRVTVGTFVPDSVVVGEVYPVSVSYTGGGGGPGQMRIARVTPQAVEGTFGACVRLTGTGGIQSSGASVRGGFNATR